MIDRNVLIWTAVQQWNKPYLFGAKWPLTSPDPSGPIDCSGFARFVWYIGSGSYKIDIGEGSTNQHANSIQITPSILILPGDLAFLKTDDPNIEHHVGLVYDKYFMIEARGIIMNGKEIGSVQLRTRKEWEARPDFLGYFRPKAVTSVEGA